MVSLIGATVVVIFIAYSISLKKNKLNTRIMVSIAMFSAVAFILSLIQFIRYPQGGGISLVSMMPVMLLSVLYGNPAGLTGGIIFGILGALKGAYVLHPVQFCLDYLMAPMALGLAGTFGNSKKLKIIFGCLFAVTLSVFASFLSGIVFFGQFAPKGMNVSLYSFIYNFTSAGVEGILSTIVIGFLPIDKFKRILKLKNK